MPKKPSQNQAQNTNQNQAQPQQPVMPPPPPQQNTNSSNNNNSNKKNIDYKFIGFIAFIVLLLLGVTGAVLYIYNSEKTAENNNNEPSKLNIASEEGASEECQYYDDLERALNEPEQVCILNLSGRGLNSLPEEFRQFRELRELDLSDNNLNEIPRELYELENLEIIDLSENNINMGFEEALEMFPQTIELQL